MSRIPAAVLLFVLTVAGLLVLWLWPGDTPQVYDEDPDLRASLLSVEPLGAMACPNAAWSDCQHVRMAFQLTNQGEAIDMRNVILGINTTEKDGASEFGRSPQETTFPAGATWEFTVEVVVAGGDRVQEVAFLDVRPFYSSNGAEPAALLARVEVFDYTA